MASFYISLNRWRPAWLVALLMMLLSNGVARAAYTTLSGSSYTQSQLAAYEWQHLQFTAENVTLNISSNLNLREIYAPNTNLTIVFSNGAKLNIDQDATISAMSVKGMTVVGNGYIDIIGNDVALGVHGGNVEFRNMATDIIARTGNAIVGKSGSQISCHNCGVNISAPQYAVKGWEQSNGEIGSISSFSVSGPNSYVTVRGAIEFVWNFNISGGYYNQIGDARFLIYGVYCTFTDAKVYITHTYKGDYGVDPTSDNYGIAFDFGNTLTVDNCTFEVVTSAYLGLRGGKVTLRNSKARVIANHKGIHCVVKSYTGQHVTLEGDLNTVLAYGKENCGIEATVVNLKGGKLVARGYNSGVEAREINVSPHEGCQFEAYNTREYEYPFQAYNIPDVHAAPGYTLPFGIKLKRPTAISGTLAGSSTVVGGGMVHKKSTSFGALYNYFGLPDGTEYLGYVKLRVPHIQNMTGVNNPFLLQPSGMTSTKHVTPGDTLLLNLAPLEPYSHFPEADGRPVVKLVKRNPNTGTSSYIVEEQADTTNGNWNWSYTFTEQDVNCYYTVEVELDGYEGSLQSRQYYVSKLENWNHPVKPVLSFLSGGIRVSNARTNQEYILLSEAQFNQFLNTPNEASWWNNSYKPTGSTLSITNCYLGEINYVVTRCKETISTLPGYEHAHASILLDNSITVTSGLKLDVTAVGSGNFADMEYYNGHVTYTTLKSGVLKVTINPLPSNATDFEGIRGQDFNIGYYGAPYNTNMCALYANSACTTPLNANTRYKTVYVKPLLSGSDLPVVNIGLYPDNGGPDDLIATTPLYLNVSDDNGNFTPYTLLVNNGEIVEAHKWENVEGIPFAVFPQRASLTGDVTVTYSNVQGPFPNIAGQTNRRPSFTVDKEKRTINMIASTQSYMLENHTYYFTVAHKINGATYGWGSLKVNIVKRELTGLTLDHTEATVDPGGTEEFSVISTPDEVWQEDYVNKTFTSSDESVATVRWDGGGRHVVIVTVPEDAPIGATATITVGALDTDVTATATITVGGEAYNLWVDNNQVTSFNAGDVLGDSTVFYQGTSQNGSLKLCGSTIANGIRSEIPSLVVDVRTPTVTVSGGSRFDGKNTYFTGNGFYKTTFSGSGNTSFIAKNVTVTDSVLLRTWSSFKAFEADNLTVEGDSAEVQAYSYNNASMVIHESLNGTITRPEGAVWNPETGWIAVGPDNLDTYVTNAYVFIKGLHGESFPLGDVNCDGYVTSGDITCVYNYMLDGDTTYINTCDVNGDGYVTSADITLIYNILLGSKKK